eukprot:3059043-Amphidinium_carterae.1
MPLNGRSSRLAATQRTRICVKGFHHSISMQLLWCKEHFENGALKSNKQNATAFVRGYAIRSGAVCDQQVH